MDDAALLAAVGRVEARGYYPASLDMLSDELGESGEVVERELDRLATGGILECHKQPDSDPAYSSRVRGGASRG